MGGGAKAMGGVGRGACDCVALGLRGTGALMTGAEMRDWSERHVLTMFPKAACEAVDRVGGLEGGEKKRAD